MQECRNNFAVLWGEKGEISVNFRQKKSFAEAKDCFLAGAEGLEPPTPGFGDRCSTN